MDEIIDLENISINSENCCNKEEEKEKARQDYLDRINDCHQDYYFFSGQLNWRCIK